jgi:DNA-binding CsgD family transcriptional regulator
VTRENSYGRVRHIRAIPIARRQPANYSESRTRSGPGIGILKNMRAELLDARSEQVDQRMMSRESGGHGSDGLGFISECSAALFYNALGRYAEALVAAERACRYPKELGLTTLVLPELIESAVRSGAIERAAEALEELSESANASGTDWALGVAARSRALLGLCEAAEEFYREAIVCLGRTELAIELARAHLLYGEWLRRENRRVDARRALRAANEIFLAAGAAAFAERCSRELLATGEHARKRTAETRFELTAQEAQIACLAGAGRTNPEIGSELYISPRTVEWHLRKVYPKLGISSRRQLRSALPDRLRTVAFT